MPDQHHSAEAKWVALQGFVLDLANDYTRQMRALETQEPMPVEFDGGMICGKGLMATQIFEAMMKLDAQVVEFDEFGRGLPPSI